MEHRNLEPTHRTRPAPGDDMFTAAKFATSTTTLLGKRQRIFRYPIRYKLSRRCGKGSIQTVGKQAHHTV